jgi:acyl-coenzyme A thioesterase PaaI-like protein
MIHMTQESVLTPAQAAPTRPAAFGVFAEVGMPIPSFPHILRVANTVVPFGRFVGVTATEVSADRAVVEIPDLANLRNQMGTVHAGALFLAADIACACAFVGAAAPRITEVEWLVVRDSSTAFRKPALGRIRAVGSVEERETRRLLAGETGPRFELDGKALLYDDADVLVATFRFGYTGQLTTASAS